MVRAVESLTAGHRFGKDGSVAIGKFDGFGRLSRIRHSHGPDSTWDEVELVGCGRPVYFRQIGEAVRSPCARGRIAGLHAGRTHAKAACYRCCNRHFWIYESLRFDVGPSVT